MEVQLLGVGVKQYLFNAVVYIKPRSNPATAGLLRGKAVNQG